MVYPYVLYNEGGHHQQVTAANGSMWGPGPWQNDYPPLVPSQNGYPPLVPWQHEPPSEQSTESAAAWPCPYPNANYTTQGPGNGSNGDVTPPEDGAVESYRTHWSQYGPEDLSNNYSEASGGPRHMLSPLSFLAYLNQPSVMSTPLDPAEVSSLIPDMPDLVQQQEQQKVSEKNGSDQRPFKCHFCGNDFKRKATLIQHKRIHTNFKPWVCSVCGKLFRAQSHLLEHVRIHTNVRPFVCIYCDRAFRQRTTLQQHLRIHLDEKPYACESCGRAFRQKSNLNRHVRTHVGKRSHFSLNSRNSSSSPQPSQFYNDFKAFLESSTEAFSWE